MKDEKLTCYVFTTVRVKSITVIIINTYARFKNNVSNKNIL